MAQKCNTVLRAIRGLGAAVRLVNFRKDGRADTRNENAEELKGIVQPCLETLTVSDNRTIEEIRLQR